ncbi:hypothetical protein F5972_33505 [Microbispora cellulosiformans]|uniref:WD40 repeat domain-containing protein n=1 Tax=Microbispora cellulosiformans TaxID=2614688 RepID=A0A5J5JVR4_9ACTN|nr:hypothetical protein [Microbispora cellulosiformans]KAA9373887.1 hypothetical protein F5972_33505 [Microbispora cellulosiformans]
MTSRTEIRLRDAFTAGAELVGAETLRPAGQAVRPKDSRRLRGSLRVAPLLAALAVVVVSVGVTAALRGSVPVRPAMEDSSGPRFLLAAGNDGLTVHDARSGEITDRVVMPRSPKGITREPGGYLLAGTGEGTTFYVAQSVQARQATVSTTWFYRIRINERGKVAELARDVIPPVTGTPASSLAVTDDGTRLAYSVDGTVCGKDETLRFCPGARLTVVDLPAGTTRTWTTNAAGNLWSLSWAADRRTLGFVVMSQARVLDTTAAGETLGAGRTVVQGMDVPAGAAISPDGHRMLVGRRYVSDGRRPHRYTIEEYSVADGRKIRTLFSAEHPGESIPWWNLIRYDATGRHLLIMGNLYPLSRLDDGHVTVLVRPEPLDSGFPDALPQEMSAAW